MIALLILIIAAACYLTSIPCRAVASKGRRAEWVCALAGMLGAPCLAILFIFQTDLFRPAEWHKGKVDMAFMVPVDFVMTGAVAAIPSLLVVWLYRRKHEAALPSA